MPTDLEIAGALCRILTELHGLTDKGLDGRRIDRVRREAIFFLHEGGEPAKWRFDRPHSAEARHMHLERKAACRRFPSKNDMVTYDHAIPLATLWDGLRHSAGDATTLLAFLKRNVIGVVLSRAENDRLNKAGLRSRLPAGSEPDDRMARYLAVGIAFEPADAAILTCQDKA